MATTSLERVQRSRERRRRGLALVTVEVPVELLVRAWHRKLARQRRREGKDAQTRPDRGNLGTG